MKKTEGLTVDFALLLIRLALGAVFIAHGLEKFGVLGGGAGISGFISFLESLKLPQPALLAYLTAGTEVGGGILVAVGFIPRIAALAILGIMVVAFLKVHFAHGFFLDSYDVPEKGEGFEYVMVLGAMALSILIAGAGKISAQGLFGGGKKSG